MLGTLLSLIVFGKDKMIEMRPSRPSNELFCIYRGEMKNVFKYISCNRDNIMTDFFLVLRLISNTQFRP